MGKDGSPLRSHLLSAKRAGWPGGNDPRLSAKCPLPLRYLWQWFRELDATERQYNMSGRPRPLTSSSVESWSRMAGVYVTPHEFEVLRALDMKMMEVVYG